MKIRCSVFIACSLDGYIARTDGSLDWLTASSASSDNEDYGYGEFMNSIDAIVIGRATYDVVETFGEWPYGTRKVFVLSSRFSAEGEVLRERVVGTSAIPQKLVEIMSDNGTRRAYIDGGVTIQSFLRNRLIDDLTVTRLPILLGSGIPLFGPLDADLKFEHLNTKTYPNGFVRSVYSAQRGRS